MERAATLQRFLLGVQVADLILKVCLFVALIVLVIIAISYLKQRKRIELEYHKKKMSEFLLLKFNNIFLTAILCFL